MSDQASRSDGDLCFLPATQLASLIRARALSPVELLEGVLARVEAVESQVHAFVTLDAARARAAARVAEAAVMRGDELGPLHGLPVTIKDLEPVAGLRTTFGSRFYEQNVPAEDGVVTARVRAAGGIILGKTNTPAFGHKDMSDNLLMPATRNPWALDRTSGGSSGGAAAALASGMGPLAHGTDGAGSIRIPATLCGVFGLKPSIGRVPYFPNADGWGARSHAGPMARNVADAALLFSVMAGPDERDPLSIDAPPDDYVAAVSADRARERLRGLRVAWSADLGYAPVDGAVREATERAAGRFAELGCHVEAANPSWDDPYRWHAVLWQVMQAGRHAARLDQRPEWVEPSLAEQIENGRSVSVVEYAQALLARSVFSEQARRFMAGYDLLLTPAMPCTAWPHDGWPEAIGGRKVPSLFDRLQFLYPLNLTGWPAATVPCGRDSHGLPIGLQIVTGWHQDTLCLQAAAAFESVQPWSHLRPPALA